MTDSGTLQNKKHLSSYKSEANNNKEPKIIGFYCFHAFGLYDIIPQYYEHLDKGDEVYLITREMYLNVIHENFDINRSQVLFIEDFKSFFGGVFTHWYSLLCVSKNFSDFYSERTEILFKGYKKKISNYITLFNVKNSNINLVYSRFVKIFYLLGIFKKLPVDFDKIYVTTKIFNPYILTPFESKIHLIIESWDHPAKGPILVNPYSSESWNSFLDAELKKYQGYNNFLPGKDLKFRYIYEFNKRYSESFLTEIEKQDILYVKENNVAIYPMCTSSSFFAFDGELDFVRDLAEVAEKQKVKLYIRPYPLAPFSDVLELKKIKNVYIGLGNEIKDGNEVFNYNHMLHKYLVIKNSNYVINVGTTFLFDAALVESECKIIQIQIEINNYNKFGKYANGYHLVKHLHTPDAIYLRELNIDKTDFNYKTYLRNWLTETRN